MSAQSQAGAALKPTLNYYDKTALERQKAEAAAKTRASVGATAWLAGMTRDQYAAQITKSGEKADPHKIYLQEQSVKFETELQMRATALKTFDDLTAKLPRGVQIKPLDPKEQTLAGMPHLGYARIGAMARKNADGSITPVVIYAANFRADPTVENGKQVFKNIRPQVDGVKNEPMFFAFALDPSGQPDKRFGKDGVVFRLGNVDKVAESCVAIAPPKPRPAQQATAKMPTPAMRQAHTGGMRLG